MLEFENKYSQYKLIIISHNCKRNKDRYMEFKNFIGYFDTYKNTINHIERTKLLEIIENEVS